MMPVKGISRIKQAYKAATTDIAEKQTNGAIYAVLSEGMAMTQVMVPVDTGNLAQSAYQPKIGKEGGKVIGHVGFTAEYAPWVHEMPGTLKGQPRAHFGKTRAGDEFGGGSETGNYWDPDGEPKFMEKGFAEINAEQILARYYRVR